MNSCLTFQPFNKCNLMGSTVFEPKWSKPKIYKSFYTFDHPRFHQGPLKCAVLGFTCAAYWMSYYRGCPNFYK